MLKTISVSQVDAALDRLGHPEITAGDISTLSIDSSRVWVRYVGAHVETNLWRRNAKSTNLGPVHTASKQLFGTLKDVLSIVVQTGSYVVTTRTDIWNAENGAPLREIRVGRVEN